MVLENKTSLVHGGQLLTVAQQYNRPLEQWLDLSTGIAPFSYPINDIPAKYWQDLPQVNDELIAAAKCYYQTEHCLPCHGSQAVIERLPKFWLEKYPQAQTVYLPKVGYKEHQKAWLQAGFSATFYQDDLPKEIENNSVIVVINPNNPSGKLFNKEELLQCYQRVQLANGLMIVDEAFMDVVEPNQSLTPHIEDDHLIILRSFGKFFGLAGLRIGFVCASERWLKVMSASFGPWHVNGPAQYVALQALQDNHWQAQQRHKLQQQMIKLRQLLQKQLSADLVGCLLFVTAYVNNAEQVYSKLCQQGVYVRLTDEKHSLRFGIATDAQLVKLEKVIAVLD